MPSAHSRINSHSIDVALVLADFGMAMEEAREAHHPCALANILRLHDIDGPPITQQALLVAKLAKVQALRQRHAGSVGMSTTGPLR